MRQSVVRDRRRNVRSRLIWRSVRRCIFSGDAKCSQASGSPTAKLLVGLVLTLAAVLLFAYYMTTQLTGLRALQGNLVDRNRKDSLQLLRVQNDLNSLALAMRDMLDAREPYP